MTKALPPAAVEKMSRILEQYTSTGGVGLNTVKKMATVRPPAAALLGLAAWPWTHLALHWPGPAPLPWSACSSCCVRAVLELARRT